MARLLPNVAMRYKLWTGIAALVLLLILIAVLALRFMHTTELTLNDTRSQHPTRHHVSALVKAVVGLEHALGDFMANPAPMNQTKLNDAYRLVDEPLQQLKADPNVQATTEYAELVEAIEQTLGGLPSYNDREEVTSAGEQDTTPDAQPPIETSLISQYQQMQAFSQNLLADIPALTTSVTEKVLLRPVQNLRVLLAEQRADIHAYLRSPNRTDFATLNERNQRIGELVATLAEHAHDMSQSQRDALAELTRLHAASGTALATLKSRPLADTTSPQQKQLRELSRLRDRLLSQTLALDAAVSNTVSRQLNDLQNDFANTKTQIATALGIGLGLGVIMAWVGAVLLVQPVSRVMRAMREIADGESDLTQRLPLTGRDEVGQLSEAFNRFVEKVEKVVLEVNTLVLQLADSAEDMSGVAQITSRGVSRQQSETDQVASAMNEMAATVQEVARNAGEAASAAGQAETETRTGSDVVRESIAAINQLASDVERAAAVIQRVEHESSDIGGILDVIRGIAEQTNLLALNAAIEAARAGDQGRGFAVVADEVRTLAQRTQRSTQEIQQMIERLQAGAHEAVQVMEEGRERTRASVRQSEQAGNSLETISGAVSTINNMNTQIASAAEQQSQVAEEINRNIVSISQVADETAGGASRMTNTSIRVAQLAEQIKRTVEQFRVGR